MNERIKELAEQADEYADYKLQMPGEYDPDWHDVRDEKFAELIVRECAKSADEWYQNHNDIHWDPAQHIKNHFGVE